MGPVLLWGRSHDVGLSHCGLGTCGANVVFWVPVLRNTDAETRLPVILTEGRKDNEALRFLGD